MQEALEARPAQSLTRGDYDRVINAYRRIYLEAPASGKADPGVMAVAELLEEMGRRFEDADILRAAIEQYEFLRQQYPGSKARFNALFRIGEIYHDDLHDKHHADETFEEFLRRYPRNQFAEEARKELSEPVVKAGLRSTDKSKKPTTAVQEDQSTDRDADDDAAPAVHPAKETAPLNSGRVTGPARVLAVRHWTTPDYTRIVIDLDNSVKFESQRLDQPDRIFFDLFDTKLDPKVLGKTLDVGDGLVKRIRISPFRPGQGRIVLEVDGTPDFAATLLNNPPRLAIDVRNTGKAPGPVPVLAKSDGDETAGKLDAAVSSDALFSNASSDESDSEPAEASKDSAAIKSNAKQAVANPKRTTVITADGIRKTIVDADDEEPVADQTVAKLDPPEIKPAAPTTSTPPTDHATIYGKKTKQKTSPPELDAREAQPTADGDRSLIRALGLKIGKIVIDPGHGGHDTGTIGPNGLEEKDLVLDVSKRLGKLLQTRLGAQVLYTRSDDTFIPLETRTAIANQEGADLFVSVHANSSRDPDARGVETYYLNFTSSADALEVAARENAVSEKSIHELQDLVKKIALKEKIEESREFAIDVDRSLHAGLAAKSSGIRDRGVKKAPFIVLIGANMPSILAEISFLSNPGDELRLETGEYRQRIAESLYHGIAKYVNGLSGVKVASKIEKTSSE
jgi:N-acetylmuramoyl-L-alanine amidase